MSGLQNEAPDYAGHSGAHTPGPWVAAADEDNDLGEFTVRTVDGDYIADVRNPYCDYDMQVAYARSEDCRIEADARLIAAAPDLASAAKVAERKLVELRSLLADHGISCPCTDEIVQLQDALIKAGA